MEFCKRLCIFKHLSVLTLQVNTLSPNFLMVSNACTQGVKCCSYLYVVNIFFKKVKRGRQSAKFMIGIACGEKRISFI